MNAPLDPLYDFRSDGYGLDDARRARMRAKVLDAIPDDTSTTTTLAPVATVARVEPWRTPDIDLSGAQTLEALPADHDSVPQPRPSRPHWSTSRRLLVAATVAVVIGLMALVAGTSRSGDKQVGTLDRSSAKMSLDELVALASAQQDHQLTPGQYQYVQTTTATRSEDGGFELSVDDNWHTTDGSGRRESSRMLLAAGAPPDAATDQTIVAPVDDQAGLPWFGPFGYQGIRNASTDPSSLLIEIRAALPGQDDAAAAEQIANFEALPTTPPLVRAAGVKVLGVLGFRTVGSITDPLGNTGVGFRTETTGRVQTIVFDPTSGRALAYWTTVDGDPNTPQDAERWVAWDQAAVADHAG